MGHVWPGFEQAALETWLRDSGFTHVHARPLPPDPEAAGPLLLIATGLTP
jgi:hypothetical protein